MGKFKVGDRVRCVNDDSTECVKAGHEYVVRGYDGEFITVDLVHGGQGGMSDWRFELVVPASGKKFKVGDKVVLITDNAEYGSKGDECVIAAADRSGYRVDFTTGDHAGDFWWVSEEKLSASAWTPKIGDRVLMKPNSAWACDATVGPGTVFPSEKEGYIIVKFDGDNGFPWNVSVDDIEPLPVAAVAPGALTITAGKFYKTRDGRKVGPIEISRDGDVAWGNSKAGYATVFVDTGLANYEGEHADDLIAEWVDEPAVIKAKYVDEPAAPAKASNDNETPAKFKVGDRVRAKETSGGRSILIGDEVVLTSVDGDYVKFENPRNGRTDGWQAYRFELVTPSTPAIVALIENGKPKPATRPVVHASQEAATAEAGRLALLHPGQEFGVFVLADSKIADVVEEVVKKTVLRAA
ncbi:hypothetical protein HFO15_19605 [Rhizobium laguerreae]|uniref:hypothetical protein n=1 Tax=Rhizobium laguerreae TaxID=1076926 RepID=UPI001C9209D5|nr:hypothetical protein [Rhizobium laguerreae]MBY3263835.1 hypothetical protein [Rhizobium laguerreae]